MSSTDSPRHQEAINDLLDMSLDMFKHIVALNTILILSMRRTIQRAIIQQLLGITILSEKAEALKEQTRITREAITEETAKINAIQTPNSKIETTIEGLRSTQRAWLAKKQQDSDKLNKATTN